MSASRAQLIVDCGGRILTSLVVTKDGQRLPVSQEIRQVATRHVPAGIVFDSRAASDSELSWEELLESIEKAGAHNFFQRARRIGLRRIWDAGTEGVLLASPLAVLSSPEALSDSVARASLAPVGFALLEALLEPVFAFLSARSMKSADVDPILVLPSNSGRIARLVLQKIFRRRGFPRPVIVPREIAAAMALTDGLATECVVCDVADDDLRLSNIHVEKDERVRRFRTLSSQTISGIGWNHWMQRIAAAMRERTATVDRAITAMLGGLPGSVTYGSLEKVLNANWIDVQRNDIADRLSGCGGAPMIVAGAVFAIDAIRALITSFGEPCESLPPLEAPILDRLVESVASAIRWLREDAARSIVIERCGSLRIDTFRGEAFEIVPEAQLPAGGESCAVEREFRFAGGAEESFLLHMLWGSDVATAGNATLCAAPLELTAEPRGDRLLRVGVQLRRSADGRRMRGTIEARLASGGASVRERFVEEVLRRMP